MTKLEQKLKELGYEFNKYNIRGFYEKSFKWVYIYIYINEDNTIKYEWCGVQRLGLKFQSKEQIRELNKALTIMQKDLEELRNVKD